MPVGDWVGRDGRRVDDERWVYKRVEDDGGRGCDRSTTTLHSTVRSLLFHLSGRMMATSLKLRSRFQFSLDSLHPDHAYSHSTTENGRKQRASTPNDHFTVITIIVS